MSVLRAWEPEHQTSAPELSRAFHRGLYLMFRESNVCYPPVEAVEMECHRGRSYFLRALTAVWDASESRPVNILV